MSMIYVKHVSTYFCCCRDDRTILFRSAALLYVQMLDTMQVLLPCNYRNAISSTIETSDSAHHLAASKAPSYPFFHAFPHQRVSRAHPIRLLFRRVPRDPTGVAGGENLVEEAVRTGDAEPSVDAAFVGEPRPNAP
jgi:hypothetical protein